MHRRTDSIRFAIVHFAGPSALFLAAASYGRACLRLTRQPTFETASLGEARRTSPQHPGRSATDHHWPPGGETRRNSERSQRKMTKRMRTEIGRRRFRRAVSNPTGY
jgi:hypothetical protein